MQKRNHALSKGKQMLMQRLLQEGSEDEIAAVHAKPKPPVCVRERARKTTCQPRGSRAAGDDSTGEAKKEGGEEKPFVLIVPEMLRFSLLQHGLCLSR